MGVNLIALAVPAFLVLIGVEMVAARLMKRGVYRFHDTVTDLSCGITSEAVGAFAAATIGLAYLGVYEHMRLFDLPSDHWATWVLGVVGYDLCYYGSHRAQHRINFLWAGHIVHHQSEDYNLAVALRQSSFVRFFVWVVYLPLALVGLPPLVFGISGAISLLYQFWIHTRLVGRLGPLEWVMNTPSHHRVHHGKNPEYLDKNYAGIFIVWDRLFGTFIAERQEPVYGTVKTFESWNPVWANLHRWSDMWRAARAAATWREKLWCFLGPPEWAPSSAGGPRPFPEVDAATYEKFDTTGDLVSPWYVRLHFVGVTAGIVYVMWFKSAPAAQLALPAALVTWTVVNWSGFFEARSWARPSELLRLVTLPPAAAWLASGTQWFLLAVGATGGIAVISAAWLLLRARREPATVIAATRRMID